MMQSVKEGNPGSPVNVRKRTTFSGTPKHLGDTNRHSKDTHVKNENGGVDTQGACKSISYSGKVLCRACEKPINGLIVQALGETWHQEHFLCSECKKPITSNRFNVEQGKPYCEEDYANIYLKKCSGCKAPIRDVVVVALNRTWHRDHFICTMCGTKLASKGFFEREDNPFCQECYEQKFCPKCNECGDPITDTAVVALGKKWHQYCFKCKNCNKPVVDSTFEVIGNRPLCSTCICQMSKV